MGIKIQRREVQRPKKEKYYEDLLKNDTYAEIQLDHIWTDTLIKEVFISEDVILTVNQWVEESLVIQPVPEVAGFVLGNHGKVSERLHWVSLETFIPSRNVTKKNPTSIEFGKAPLQELDKMREGYPHLDIVGWFHTHPGHSPYLSATDLYTHDGFFQHPYQLAIVLDSLTEQFQTGFFSRKTNGLVNNAPCNQPWIAWKSWLTGD